jgi:uncharacterized alpha-E superfamily protein
MLSRTASSLYWLQRYLERAESTARLLEGTLNLSLDLPDEAEDAWEAVVATSGDLAPFTERFGRATQASALRFLAFDPDNDNSVLNAVKWARENARQVREQIPEEAWELINSLYHGLRGVSTSDAALTVSAEALHEVRATGRAVEGALQAAMPREEGWQFGRLGLQIERADQTSRLVDANYQLLPPYTEPGSSAHRWEGLLKSAGAAQAFRRRHGATQGTRAAAFLLLDPAFPRSVSFCLTAGEQALRAITGTPVGQFRDPAQKALGRLAADLRYTELEDMLAKGLHHWLDEFQARLNEVGASISKEYFDPPQTPAGAPAAAAKSETRIQVTEEQQQQ